MKKASTILALALIVMMLFGTGLFYVLKNAGSGPLYIRIFHSPEPGASVPMQTDPSTDGPLNINTADVYQLASLPGIGSVLAQRIVDYRTQNGPFRSPAELMNIPGIGETTLENILDLITTGGST